MSREGGGGSGPGGGSSEESRRPAGSQDSVYFLFFALEDQATESPELSNRPSTGHAHSKTLTFESPLLLALEDDAPAGCLSFGGLDR